LFKKAFLQAQALLQALEHEILSRELPVKTELSFEVAATEMDAAQDLLDNAKGMEVFIRAAGVIARVAFERHLLTVADSRKLSIAKNPPSKSIQMSRTFCKPSKRTLSLHRYRNRNLTAYSKSLTIAPIQRKLL
jgi:hypothetical protein